MTNTNRWFQIHWDETNIENVYLPDIAEVYRHMHGIITDESADLDEIFAPKIRVEAMDSGFGYWFAPNTFGNPLEDVMAGLRAAEQRMDDDGLLTGGLSRQDVDAIRSARREILRHLEGHEVDFRTTASQLAQVLSRHNSGVGFGHKSA